MPKPLYISIAPDNDRLIDSDAMGRSASATARALLRCARLVSGAVHVDKPCIDVATRHVRRYHRRNPNNLSWQSPAIGRCINLGIDRPRITAHSPVWTTSVQHMSGRGRGASDDVTPNANQAHRVNEQITARQIRLVMESSSDESHVSDGDESKDSPKTHEVISTLVALRRAKHSGLDLVEVNARADPPVCRLMNYDTFRYALKVKEKNAKKAKVERRRHDQIKELKLTARISPNDVRVKANKASQFLSVGHKVTLRVEFKTNDGVKQSLRPKAGAVLFTEFRDCLVNEFDASHVVIQEEKMVGPNHMTITLAPEKNSGKGGKGSSKGIANVKSVGEEKMSDMTSQNDTLNTNTQVDHTTALAEAHTQGELVRALKARKSAGDEAVTKEDVDQAVAKLLELKQLARKVSAQSGAHSDSKMNASRGMHTAARSFFFGTDTVLFPGSPMSSRPYSTPVNSSSKTSLENLTRVGEAKAKAKAKAKVARRAASDKKKATQDALAKTVKRETNIDGTAPMSSAQETAPGAGAGAGARGDAYDDIITDTEALRDIPVNSSSNLPEQRAVTWSDPSTFRLGSQAEEHLAYEREKRRVDALLEERRIERAEIQKRRNGFYGEGGGSGSRSSDQSSGAWAGAAAAATLAVAVVATLFATADSKLISETSVDNQSPRFASQKPTTNNQGKEREELREWTGGSADTSSFAATGKQSPVSDAVVSFVAGAAVVVSALGWPPH